jgi:hypothetical protein
MGGDAPAVFTTADVPAPTPGESKGDAKVPTPEGAPLARFIGVLFFAVVGMGGVLLWSVSPVLTVVVVGVVLLGAALLVLSPVLPRGLLRRIRLPRRGERRTRSSRTVRASRSSTDGGGGGFRWPGSGRRSTGGSRSGGGKWSPGALGRRLTGRPSPGTGAAGLSSTQRGGSSRWRSPFRRRSAPSSASSDPAGGSRRGRVSRETPTGSDSTVRRDGSRFRWPKALSRAASGRRDSGGSPRRAGGTKLDPSGRRVSRETGRNRHLNKHQPWWSLPKAVRDERKGKLSEAPPPPLSPARRWNLRHKKYPMAENPKVKRQSAWEWWFKPVAAATPPKAPKGKAQKRASSADPEATARGRVRPGQPKGPPAPYRRGSGSTPVASDPASFDEGAGFHTGPAPSRRLADPGDRHPQGPTPPYQRGAPPEDASDLDDCGFPAAPPISREGRTTQMGTTHDATTRPATMGTSPDSSTVQGRASASQRAAEALIQSQQRFLDRAQGFEVDAADLESRNLDSSAARAQAAAAYETAALRGQAAVAYSDKAAAELTSGQ